MSAHIQHYLFMGDQPAQRDRYHYEVSSDRLYISVGQGSEWYNVVGTPEQIRDWFSELHNGVIEHVAKAIADREEASG